MLQHRLDQPKHERGDDLFAVLRSFVTETLTRRHNKALSVARNEVRDAWYLSCLIESPAVQAILDSSWRSSYEAVHVVIAPGSRCPRRLEDSGERYY
jgi:hypothetical protein